MRPEILYPLFTDIENLKGIGPKTVKLLSHLISGRRIIDLLFHLPSNIIDRTYQPKLKNAIIGKICTLKVKVVEHIPPKSKQQPYRVIVEDDTDQLTLIFFKVYADSISKKLPIGSTKIISGQLDKFNNQLQMPHPDFIIDEKDAPEMPLIEAVYPLTAGITNKMITKYIRQALAMLPQLPEWLDEKFIQEKQWDSFRNSLIKAHSPKNTNDIHPFTKERERLAYDEFLSNQLTLAILREKHKKLSGYAIKGNNTLKQQIISSLPFQLTASQEKVLSEIYHDQAQPYRMLRLLQGDVGSGKTIVSLLSIANTIEAGMQTALMVPTEILAKQHYETITSLLKNTNLNIALLTGKTKTKERKEILQNLQSSKINLIIGTHALFQDEVKYNNLGLIIIDEQHRFGVQQRLKLSQKGHNPDILVMTATPIPRTLILSTYGDMEHSVINQLPQGRKPVDTRVIPLNKINDIISGLKRQIDSGAMAYWVCPLVEEKEQSDLAAAITRFNDLQKIFGNKVGLVHGKMKEQEKNEVMENFCSGKIKLLVATTVIEVGVNVPSATIMIIEHAERFGLSQLHQLRGRIKRSEKSSTCLLLYNGHLSETAYERLNIMKETEDGFIIAEKDLELRGGGEILGIKQSGFENFHLADMQYHRNLLYAAHKDAQLIIHQDPNLQKNRGSNLRNLLYLFEEDKNMKNYQA